MRKVIVSEFVTLDGVMESPGEPEELGGRGGWVFPFWSDEANQYKRAELFAADALLLGRVTYDLFAASWPTMTDEDGFAERMNSIPKYVASTTLQQPAWNNTRRLEGDLAEAITGLKQAPGQDILVAGSAALVRALMHQELIDEYRLMVFPIVLGMGKRLFQDGSDLTQLRLAETSQLPAGVVVLHYRPAGDLAQPAGSQPTEMGVDHAS